MEYTESRSGKESFCSFPLRSDSESLRAVVCYSMTIVSTEQQEVKEGSEDAPNTPT